MSTQLIDIVNAVHDYAQQKIVRKVKNVTPALGIAINAGEKFFFALEVTNATAANGGVALEGVSYRIQIGHSSVAQLIVPPTSVGNAMTAPVNGQQLTPGQEVDHYFLFKNSSFAPGQAVIIDNLEGVAKKANSSTSITLSLRFRVAAFAAYHTGAATGQVTIL